ncbi:hypothetical protein N665_0277s0003 [Sinapis alba]|nr:hypothetical protein N665_0277s0003 [Sinapis alba]
MDLIKVEALGFQAAVTLVVSTTRIMLNETDDKPGLEFIVVCTEMGEGKRKS